MPPVSSLIFVVILAVWAVYLVQHWVRRRDHLATARSVDRFSEAMRVLERRRALPRPDLSEPTPRSYSVSPLRPARPEVVVKRGASGATAVAPSPAYRRAQTAARVRAGALLVGSAALVALVALALSGVVGTGWIYAGIGALALSVSYVRWSVARERARRRRAAARPRRPAAASGDHANLPAASAAARGATPAARAAAPAPPARPARNPEAAPQPAGASQHVLARQSVAATTRTARRSVGAATLYDVEAVEAATRGGTADPAAAAAAGAVAEQAPRTATPQPQAMAGDPDTTWDPLPVPPPTYTLKARAHRGVAATPTGSAQLPADGAEMALAEEFEELPRVDRVG